MLHRRHQAPLQLVAVILVRVPGDARAVHGRDETHARLHQTAGQQVRLTPAMPAVALAHGRRFLGEVKRALHLRRSDQGKRLGSIDVKARARGRIDMAGHAVQLPKQTAPRRQTRGA